MNADVADSASGIVEKLQPGSSLVYKDPETGAVHVLSGVPQDMMEQIQQHLLLQKESPQFEVQQLEVDGHVEGKLLHLDVTLQVIVHAEERWVRVPIGFTDFQVTSLQHETEAENGRATLEKSKLPVKSWVFRGQGAHSLRLTLIGTARVSQNGQWRAKIDAPIATRSHLTMSLSDKVDSAELTTEQPFRLLQEAEGKSTIETWGLSSATEILWTPAVSAGEQDPTVQASSPAQMTLDLTVGSLLIDQTLVISGGAVSHLDINLPAGFESASISVKNAAGDEIARPIQRSEKDSVRLEFTAPVTGNIRLQYDIGIDDPSALQKLAIRLPDIEGVINESGDLEVYVPVGLEVDRELHDVRQIRVTTGRGPNVAVFGYRLRSTESLLMLTVRETEAFYSVIPQISLAIEHNNVLMTAQFSMNIVRGSLSEIEIVWPELASGGWKILPGDTYQVVGETRTPLTGFEADSHTLRLSERLSGQFDIELQAFRPRDADRETEQFSFFLPDIAAPAPHTTLVSLIESDEYSMSISAHADQASFPLLPVSGWPANWKEREEPQTVRLVDSPDQAISLKVTPQKPEVKVAVEATMTPRLGSLYVHERMTFDVRHRDLSQVTLTVPDVSTSVMFEGVDETLELLEVDGQQVTYLLPTPVRGTFIINVDYAWTPDASDDARVNLPLVVPSALDERLTMITVGTNVPETLLIDREQGWGRVYSTDHKAAWQSAERHDAIPLFLKHTLAQDSVRRPKVCVLKSVVHGNRLVTSVTGVYSTPVQLALFSLPENAEVLEGLGFIGGEQVEAVKRITDGTQSQNLIQVQALENDEDSYTATLVVSQPLQGRSSMFALSQHDMPRISGTVDDCNVIWLLGHSDDRSIVYCGDQLSEIGTLSPSTMIKGRHQAVRSGLETLLTPYSVSVKNAALESLRSAEGLGENYQVVAGTLYRDSPTLIIFSRQATFLGAAIAGLAIYFLFLKLRLVSLLTAVVLLVAATTALVAIVPAPAHAILIRLLPGCVVAVIAAVLQRTFGRRPASTPLVDDSNQTSTVFTVDSFARSASPSTVLNLQSEADVTSSQLSATQ